MFIPLLYLFPVYPRRLTRTVSFKAHLPEKTIKELRADPAKGVAAWAASEEGAKFVFQGIKAKGLSDRDALCLAEGPSVYAGFLSGMGAIALYWLSAGGLDSAKPQAPTNDLHDLDYGVLGALSHSL